MHDNLILVVQARIGGSRFPGKVLHPILGQPLILWLLDRLSYIPSAPPIIVATPPTEENRAIWDLCDRHGYQHMAPPCAENDVLSRYAMVAEACGAKHIIRVTGDCPLIDPLVLETLWQTYIQVEIPTFLGIAHQWPDGQDCEVFPASDLARAAAEAQRPSDREHVTPYLWNHPELFQPRLMACQFDLSHLQYSVDTPADMALVAALLKTALARWGLATGWGYREIAYLIETDPEIRALHGGRPPRNQAYLEQVAQERDAAYRGPRIGTWAEERYGEKG
ncbi:MAG TPA: NTP transferase domain-containing protein [Candidatus Tectomicrobia bacterium]